ncbi:MAG TPA: 3'-5' exonuclease [Actinomycetota bacterium]|nr:3'-5' exonuclease [Actinomycetota bacterium]
MPARIPEAPSRAERRKAWREAPLAAIDFETTGLDFAKDRIVSYGVVPIDGADVRDDLARYDLVDPGPVPVSEVSRSIHGLGPDELAGASPAAAAREALRDLLGGRYLVTWNGIVEVSFLAMLFGTTDRRWSRRSVDVRWLVLAVLGPDGGALTLSDAAARFGVTVTTPHHALDDALVTARLFLAAGSELAATGAIRSVRDVLRLGHARGAAARRPLVPR